MDPHTKAEFDKLLSKSANKTCVDCKTFNPQWASVNNGCFMCIKCAGNHRSMGVHITFVRSVTMDSWSKIQLARMKNGGNAKLKQFWKQQKFPSQLTPKQRLNNTAMDKYRENLLSIAKGQQTKEVAFVGYTEREEILNKSFSNLSNASNSSSSLHSLHSQPNEPRKQMQGFGNTNYDPNNNNNNNNNDTWNEFWAGASSLAAKTSAVASDLAQKSKTAAVSISKQASEKASNIKTKLGDEEYQANLKKNATDTLESTKKTLSSWWSVAATSVTNVMSETFNENKANKTDVPTLYNNNEDNNNNTRNDRKKMAALSSDQYFNKNSYGTSNSSSNQNQMNKTKTDMNNAHASEVDILGMNNNKSDIDNLAPPFPKQNKKPQTQKKESDDFDDWGFDGESDHENVESDHEPKNEATVDITQAINGTKNIDLNGNKSKNKNVDSLLEFNGKKKSPKADGNSSDDLDAFFDEMEKEENDENDENNRDTKKKTVKNNNTNTNANDMMDLLGSHEINNKTNTVEDDWGWN